MSFRMFRHGWWPVALVAFTVAVVFSGTVRSVSAEGHSAVIDRGGTCILVSTDHGIPGVGTLMTDRSQSIETPSGNKAIRCHFEIPEGFEPERAIRKAGFPCDTLLGETTNSRSIATPKGTVTLICILSGGN